MCRMERGGSLVSDEATKLFADEQAFFYAARSMKFGA